MTDFEFIECGQCIGCKLKQEQTALLKRLDDDLYMPALRRLAKRYDPPGSQRKPDPRSYESRAIMRERDALLEHRSRVFSATIRDFGYPGCCRLVLIPRAA